MTKKLVSVSFVLGALALGVWAALAAEPDAQTGEQIASPESTTTSEEAKSQPIDITDKMRQYNSDEYASPPTKFRQGHTAVASMTRSPGSNAACRS